MSRVSRKVLDHLDILDDLDLLYRQSPSFLVDLEYLITSVCHGMA